MTHRLILTLGAVLVTAGTAMSWEGHFERERTVLPGGAGANRLEIDVDLLGGAQPLRPGRDSGSAGGLDDLRLFDAARQEVPYLLIAPPQPKTRFQDGTVLPIAATRTESGFEVDLRSAQRIDRFEAAGIRAPFLKRLRLEGSGDRSHWVMLADSTTMFDLPDEHLQRTTIDFVAGDFRYLRVTWDDRNSARVTLPATAGARVVATDPVPPPVVVSARFERRASEPGRSRFHLQLPAAHLPVVAIDLACGGGHLLRNARVSEPQLSGSTVVPVPLGEGQLRRSIQGDIVAADLRIAIHQPAGPELDLVVDDESNPPLELLGVSVELEPLPWIYFESADAAPLTARFGAPRLRAPRYDLEAVRASAGQLPVAAAHWGPGRDLGPAPADDLSAESGQLPPGAARLDASGFRYAREIAPGSPGLIAVVVDAAMLAHSRDLSDVRIVDADGGQVPYVVEHLDEPLSVELDALQPAPPQPDDRRGVSRYRLQLPYADLPAARLVLTTSARVFERRVTLEVERPPTDARSKARRRKIVSSAWQHSDSGQPAPTLVLPLPTLATTTAELVVDEGDNRPLPLSKPQLLLPAQRLRFFRTGDGPLRVLYGDPHVGAPRYDLALLAARVIGARAFEMTPAAEAVMQAIPTGRGDGHQRTLFWAALTVMVVALLGLLARLLVKGSPAGS